MRPLLVLLLVSVPAQAGPLHDVVNGLAHATGGTPAASGGGGGGGSVAGDIVGAVLDGILNPDLYTGGGGGSAPSFFQPTLYGYSGNPTPDATLNGFVGLQSVVDSDGAATLELHAAWNDLGIGLQASRYFEGPVGGQPAVHLDLFRLFGSYRLAGDGVWLDAGGTAVLALADETLVGATAGLRVERPLVGEIRVSFQARGSLFTHGIVGVEAEVALDLWILRAGYRLLAFDVGPPLHGPELGIAIGF